MPTPKLKFNLLTFEHPKEEYSFWFTNAETEGTQRLFHKLVPAEVKQHFGEQEHYYTSFDQPKEGFLEIKKGSKTWSASIVKRYFNALIHKYFIGKGFLVKPNFIEDNEVWFVNNQLTNSQYTIYEKFNLRV